MIGKLDHIGIAVRSIDEAVKFYSDVLGLEVKHIEVVEEQKVRVAMLPVGETRLELLESTDPDGPVARHIEARGEGIQHIALGVADVEAALKRLASSGVRLIDEAPRRGAGGAKIAFVHPRSTHGLLLELCQREGSES